ncbi:VPS70 Vacuolar protein sorting-associated protein 70 [Candida maltosa Xu316]
MTTIGKSQNAFLTTEDSINKVLLNLTRVNHKSETNLVGDDNLALVDFVESKFKQFKGFKVQSFNHEVDLTTPVSSSLKLVDNLDDVIYEPELFEPKSKTPAYFALGTSGDVSANYIFVNQGQPNDYELLFENNVDVTDKIVIIKSYFNYTNITVGEKIAIAEYHGAKGVIHYYDDVSPEYNNAISRDTLLNNTRIPAIPVSKKVVTPILETLTTTKFKNWPYPAVSDESFRISLNTKFTGNTKKFTTIVGTIKGIINDADIVIGARRDSYTSSNPLSGHAIMLEIMRYYQNLIKLGWKPFRTIKFVSWDATYLNLLGVESITNDTSVFNPKRTIAAYISIDGDAVTGSTLKVNANAVFNHLLKHTSKSITFPKAREVEDDDDDDYDDDDDEHKKYTTLFHYWKKQSGNYINNNLGLPIYNSESLIFQQHLATPIINIKFENNPETDPQYVPHSNYYSYDWLIKENVDADLILHGSLIRFIGLLGISLVEHEVYDYKTYPYFTQISKYLKSLFISQNDKIKGWEDEIVPNYLIFKSTIFQDLDTDNPVTFKQIINQFQNLTSEVLPEQARIFDEWNVHVEEGLMEDYPWYMYYKKLQRYAQYKVSNYKLAYLENDLQLSERDYTYLNTDESGNYLNSDDEDYVSERYFNSIIYGKQSFQPIATQEFFSDRYHHGTFTELYEALENGDFTKTVKWLVLIYEKLNNIDYKMT